MPGKRKKKKRNRRRGAEIAEVPLWMDDDGVHAMLPGKKPDAETLERMTRVYQEKVRNSPLWDEMVRQFGAAKAEELLGQFRADLRSDGPGAFLPAADLVCWRYEADRPTDPARAL